MERLLLDTNAVVSLFTDRNEAQRNSVVLVLAKAVKGEMEIALHQHVLSETVFTLLNVYAIAEDRVAEILRDLIDHPGVVLENEIDWEKVLQFWPSIFHDFGDAMVGAVAKEKDCPVFTFDRGFGKKLKDIKVIWANAPR